MPSKQNKILKRIYVSSLISIAAFCSKFFNDLNQKQKKNIVLLISRSRDIELLIGLHEKVRNYDGFTVCFWITEACLRKEPEVLQELERNNASIEFIVNFRNLGRALRKLKRATAFLTTVESTAAKHKLPYALTSLANVI